ncbi:hypothetical protein N7522_006431 [Penicillium canescens]|nr:hypothetical protein N7522_006431 [Penicillium canescens]
MRSSTLSPVLLCIQGLCLLVASDVSISLSSQTVPSCQTGRVGVTTKEIISQLAKRMITITLTTTSTDTTDCTCTETALSTTVSTDEIQTTTSLMASSSPQATASQTSTDVQSTSIDVSTTTTIPASTETPVGDISTVTDWRVTTVVSFITLAPSAPTPLSSKSFTQDVSVSVQYTTVTVHDTSYTTRWRTTELSNATPISQSIPSSNSGVFVSASSDQSSTITVSTTTAIGTSVIDSSQVDLSTSNTPSLPSESAPDEAPNSDPSASAQYTTVTFHDTSYVTSWTMTNVPNNTAVTQSTPASSSEPSKLSEDQVTLSSRTSPAGNSTIVVSTTTVVVYTSATESPQGGLWITVLPTTTGDAAPLSSLPLPTSPGDPSGQPTEEGPDSSLVASQSNTDGSRVSTSQISIHHATEQERSSRVQSSTEPFVTPANPVTPSGSPSAGQAQTDDRSAVLSSTSVSPNSSLSICPTRVINPTYTPTSRPPRDYTWGCPPNFLCNPSKRTANGECNFEAGPPADTYYCAPEECIPSPPLPSTSFQGSTTSSGQIRFTVAPGFINLSPLQFGLGYDIFEFPEPRVNTQRDLNIPGKCYGPCNDAMEAAESITKTQKLCSPGSPFQVSHRACKSCVDSGSGVRTTSSALPEFQQFLFYCEGSTNATSTIQSHSATYSRGRSSSSIFSATGTRDTVYSNFKQTVKMGAFTIPPGKATSTSRIGSTSSHLPASPTGHLVYTGGAFHYPARSFWEVMSVFLFCVWFTF